MRLVEFDKNKLTHTGYKKTKAMRIIEEFVESGLDCAKVEDWQHKTPSSCQNSLTNAIRRLNIKGIRAIQVEYEIYLVRED